MSISDPTHSALACREAGRCGGCPLHALPLGEQRAAKRAALVSAWRERGLDAAIVVGAEVRDAGALGFRERLDVRLADGALGLLGEGGALTRLTTCPLAVPVLARAFEALAQDPPPTARASLRLRVPPAEIGRSGQGREAAARERLGVWIDLGHAALKALLDERAWLARWAARATIELGPKGRVVCLEGDQVVLGEAQRAPWSATWLGPRIVPLASRVMDFGQPGAGPNRVLVEAVLAAVRASGARRVLELGAGAGNLTLPMVHGLGLDVRALELDTGALSANLAGLGAPPSHARCEPIAASFERAQGVAAWVRERDVIVCDPARGGLGGFIDGLATLAPSLRPASIVYVSCHLPALARDAERLAALGWSARHAVAVDQFPWTPHAEWVVRFAR